MTEKPINFLNNTFIYNSKSEQLNGEKKFISLPDKKEIIVNKYNLNSACQGVYIPISQLSAHIQGVQFVNDIKPEDCETFDIETDDRENFIMGFVGDKKFTDPKEMVKEMRKYKCVYAYNNFHFDNEVLAKYSPEDFIAIKQAGFIAHTLKSTLMIDLLPILRFNTSFEGYSSEVIANLLGFKEKRADVNSKEERCKQDITINRLIFNKYNIPKVFNTLSSLANIDPTLLQVSFQDRVRKYILINSYLKRGFLPVKQPEAKQINIQSIPDPVKMCKPGLYQEYHYLDISSAHARTAVNLKNLGIYDDNIFSKMEEELIELCKDNEIKPFVKGIANALVGSMYDRNNYFRNEEIYRNIITTLKENVELIIGNYRKQIVYANTDCFIVPQSINFDMPNYELREKYLLSWCLLYNDNKWVGLTKYGIQAKGFTKLDSSKPKILKTARDEIFKKITECKPDKIIKLINKPKSLVSETIKNIKKLDKSNFKIVVRKNSNSCTKVDMIYIWDGLHFGFNELYYNDKGDFVLDKKNIGYKYYRKLIINYAEQFKFEEKKDKKNGRKT